MTWRYGSPSGCFWSPDGELRAIGYSGFGPSRNQPKDEALPGLGPIPVGRYRIGDEEDSDTKGPVMMRLTPVGHDAHGRSGFEIHGDSREHPGAASHGCIILSRNVREYVAASEDRDLEVVLA